MPGGGRGEEEEGSFRLTGQKKEAKQQVEDNYGNPRMGGVQPSPGERLQSSLWLGNSKTSSHNESGSLTCSFVTAGTFTCFKPLGALQAFPMDPQTSGKPKSSSPSPTGA